MVEAGAFARISAPAAVAELLFWQLQRRRERAARRRRAADSTPAELAAQALDGLSPAGRALRPAADRLPARPKPAGRLARRLRPSGAARRMDRVSPAAAARRPPPTAAQRRAADPTCSIWVTASAGTGKTRVLADRVLRLLLAGSDSAPDPLPDLHQGGGRRDGRAGAEGPRPRSPCCRETQLEAELEDLLGRPATAAERARARTLLAQVLDLPAGLPIMTIHGFCQSLLKRFPLEAGVVPHFEVLDPRSAADLLREAQAEVLASRRGEIRAALDRLAVLLGEATLAEGLARAARGSAAAERAAGAPRRRGRAADRGGVRRARRARRRRRRAGAPRGLRRSGDRSAGPARRGPRARARQRQGRGMRAETIADWLAADARGARARLARLRGRLPDQGRGSRGSGRSPEPAPTPCPQRGSRAARRAGAPRRLGRAREGGRRRRAHRGAAADRRGGARGLRAAQAPARRARFRRPDRRTAAGCSSSPASRPGCSTSSTSRSTICWSTRARTPAPSSGRSSRRCARSSSPARARGRLRRTLFVVGDEKQSIMSVQGADVATYRRFRQRASRRAPRRPAALAGGAARPLVPLGQADPRSGRRGLRRSRGARRRGERRTTGRRTSAFGPRRPGWSRYGR